MKPDRAIKILSDEPETLDFENDPDALDALKLANEALKAYAQARRLGLPLHCDGLPGETKE